MCMCVCVWFGCRVEKLIPNSVQNLLNKLKDAADPSDIFEKMFNSLEKLMDVDFTAFNADIGEINVCINQMKAADGK